MVNKVILLGNVGADPEVKYLSEGVSVARIRVATSESYTNKTGERITNTEWHNVVAWNASAKYVENYVKKGAQLYVEGRITYRSYEKDGVTRYYTEIVSEQLRLLGSRRSEDGTDNNANHQSTTSPQASNTVATEMTQSFGSSAGTASDDLPF